MIDLIEKLEEIAPQQPVNVYLQTMHADDVPAVSKLEKRCYSLNWNPAAYVTEIGNPAAEYIVAKRKDNHEIVGFGGVWVVMDELHITTLAVDPKARGQKVGERILIELMFEGVKRGALRATLEVRQSNTVAHNLYLKYEFADVAVRKHYYSDNGENAIIMWAEEVASQRYLKMLAARKKQLAKQAASERSA